jgi:hypothetical protein
VEKPPITTPTVAVAAITPKVSENGNQNNINSPWERSTTDNYSPWTMNSPGRLEASANTAENVAVPVISANPVSPTATNPTVPQQPQVPQPQVSPHQTPQLQATAPLVPMMPIAPNQPEITTGTVINNNNNNNNNNNFVHTNNTVNNTIPSVNAVQPVLPNSSGSRDVVTFYSQQNIPVSQNYLTTYRRVDGSPVPAPMQPTPLPVYPPQTHNGNNGNGQSAQNQYRQSGQNQYGHYEQIVPPSYQGIPNNMTTSVPMQPVVPIQGTASQPIPATGAIPQETIPMGAIPMGMISPQGMVPSAGTMPMSQPIPLQATAPMPQPAYHSSPLNSYPAPSVHSPVPIPVAPSYYPPTSAVPYYYQQGNTPSPYRRLY